MKQVRVLRVLVVVLGAALAAKMFWPQQIAYLHRFLVQPRCGCGFLEGLRSIPLPIQDERDRDLVESKSRVLTRDRAGYELWSTPRGQFWAPIRDNSLIWVIAELDHEEYGSTAGLRNAVVLDCGAHLGVFTRIALAAGARQVISIEPGPEQIECLGRTFQQEIAEGRVIVCPKGVWNQEGELNLNLTNNAAMSTLIDTRELSYDVLQGAEVKVPVTTIDNLVKVLKLPRVDFIKMDIEGSEVQALTGGHDTISRFKPRLAIAAYHRHDDSVRIPAVIRQANGGYRQQTLGCRFDIRGHTHPVTFLFY